MSTTTRPTLLILGLGAIGACAPGVIGPSSLHNNGLGSVSSVAPAGLTYSLGTAAYPRGVAIPSNAPALTGGDGSITYSATLPAGLSIDPSTGVISGTPSADTPAAPAYTTYTVTATNNAGSTTFDLKLLVIQGFVVNSTGSGSDFNPGDGFCDATAASNVCTIRAAFREARASATPRSIWIPNGTYNLTATPTYSGAGPTAVTFTGESKAGVIIDGGNARQLFAVDTTTVNLSFSNITFQNANTGNSGGAVGIASNVTGNLSFSNCDFISNDANYAGAVEFYYMNGTVDGCTFTGNTGQTGGAIDMHNSTTVTITNSTFTGNQATLDYGGAIWGNVNLDNVTFTNNSAANLGGAIFTGGGTNTYNRVYFNNNQAASNGGALGIYDGPVTITNSTFYSNDAVTGGGAIYIGNITGTVITNTTFSQNTAGSYAGAIGVNTASSFTGTHLTFYANTAGSAFRAGAVEIANLNVPIRSSLFVGNLHNGVANNCTTTGAGAFTGDGFNMSDVGGDLCTNNLQTAGAINLVTALGLNGGVVPNHALSAGSAAINTIPGGSCLSAVDTRGYSRPVGGACDAGAVEYP